MPIILAIETSSELASAALLHGNNIFVRESSGIQTHSQSILPLIQELLAEAEVSLSQCDALAFGCGPGSFTGVRTACGIIQGLAFGGNLPVIPVVTLQAMAESCRQTSGATDVLAIIDARMGEVYWAQYRYTDDWQVVVEPTLSTAAAVQPQGPVAACGNGLAAYAAAFEGRDFLSQALLNVMPHAQQVALLARTAFLSEQVQAARDAQPLYLRNKVALTTAERQLKSGAIP